MLSGNRAHVALQRKIRTTRAHILYPPELCRSICKGWKKHKHADAMRLFSTGHVQKMIDEEVDEAIVESDKARVVNDWEHAWDDVTGKLLNPFANP